MRNRRVKVALVSCSLAAAVAACADLTESAGVKPTAKKSPSAGAPAASTAPSASATRSNPSQVGGSIINEDATSSPTPKVTPSPVATASPTASPGTGGTTPTPTVSPNSSGGTPTPAPSGSSGGQTPTPTPTGSSGGATPTPTPTGSSGGATPTPTPTGSSGGATPTPTPSPTPTQQVNSAKVIDMKISLAAAPPSAGDPTLSAYTLGVPTGGATPLYPTSVKLYAHVYLSNGTKNTTVTWSSDKPGVAAVDATGNVTAGSTGGTAAIKAKSADVDFGGTQVEMTCNVTVKADGSVDVTIE
jgi:hypothetical protein